MKNSITKIILLASAFLPLVSHAQLTGTRALIESGAYLIGYLIPVVFSLALLYFFYGVAKYIRSEGAGKAEGKQIMIWGVVALFVMSSVWGLVRFIGQNLTITDNSAITIPTFKPN